MIKNLSGYILNFNRCNQKCLFCMVSEENQKDCNLTFDLIAKEIMKAKVNGYKNIDFYGGEPTIFLFLKKAIKLVNRIGLTATLATNAIKFSSPKFTEQFFQGINIRGIRTSLHSSQSSIHDKITQIKSSFNKTIKGIKNILKFNRRLTVNVVITSLNYKELPEVAKFIYKLGVRGIKFSGLVFRGRALSERWLRVNLSSISPYLWKAFDLSRKLSFHLIECEKLPLCILNKEQLEFVKFISEYNSNFIKPEICNNCKYADKCNGLDPISLTSQNLNYLHCFVKNQGYF